MSAAVQGALSIALIDLLESVPPGHRDEPWTWEDEECDIAIRLCLCCGRVGHYQESVEARIAERGFTEGVCIGEDGRLHDGHHRVVAAMHLGIERVPLETKAEADSRWKRDHGGTMWELRQFGDVHPGEAWAHVQRVRQQARDFVAREAVRETSTRGRARPSRTLTVLDSLRKDEDMAERFDMHAAAVEDAKTKLRMIRDEPRFELLTPSEAVELLVALGEPYEVACGLRPAGFSSVQGEHK